MSTRSMIGVQEATGEISAVYCHSDGYLSGNGATLLEYYNNEAAARDIVNLGALSFLDKRLAPSKGEKHSFDYGERVEGVTVAYCRDRGERKKEISNLLSVIAMKNEGRHLNAEFLYLFNVEKSCWSVKTNVDNNNPFVTLTKETCED